MVSSKDVAKRAGVSQTTVSRVLNTPELVKKPTVEKVLQAIRELDYVPNMHARSLVQNKTFTISLLSGPLHNPFFVDSTSHIVDYANENGYSVDVQFVNDEKIDTAYAKFLERKVDGVILSCIFYDDPFMERLKKLDVPYIMFNRKHKDNRAFVEIDNFEAGRMAVNHLLDLGHEQIVYIGGNLSVSTFCNRFKGFREAFPSYKDDVVYHSNTTRQDVEKGIDRLLADHPETTAIVAATDSIALMVMNHLIAKGLHIPEDISLIGIDNVDLASHLSIQLTTVGNQDGENLGLTAIRLLVENLENKNNYCGCITKSVKLFNRKTTRKHV